MGALASILAMAAFLGLLFYAAQASQKKRLQAFSDAAGRLGFVLEPDGRSVVDGPFMGCRLFLQGDNGEVTALIRGTAAGQECSLFDYSYTYYHYNSGSNTYRQTVAAFVRAQGGLPHFVLKPEGLLEKLGAAVGFQDIDFDADPGFSSAYDLSGKDEAAIRSVFRPDVLSLFRDHPGWTVEAVDRCVMLYKDARTAANDELDAFFQEARTLTEGLRP